jgi:hypothetical protein
VMEKYFTLTKKKSEQNGVKTIPIWSNLIRLGSSPDRHPWEPETHLAVVCAWERAQLHALSSVIAPDENHQSIHRNLICQKCDKETTVIYNSTTNSIMLNQFKASIPNLELDIWPFCPFDFSAIAW